jgi:tRNA threonylcarbamoyl adenosine modification protein (Sua5/YciO/YrdC/YwlC family)
VTDLERAADMVARGTCIVMPTDTVYGLAASPASETGICSLFEVKERPGDKAIPILAASIYELKHVGVLEGRALELAAQWWPGPLTLVVPRAAGFEVDLGGTDASTVAVRVPRHDLARELLARTGPLAVTSANRSGAAPATTVDEARAYFGDAVAVYLDAGPAGGEVSTVLSMIGDPEVLRAGAVPAQALLDP